MCGGIKLPLNYHIVLYNDIQFLPWSTAFSLYNFFYTRNGNIYDSLLLPFVKFSAVIFIITLY